MSFSLPRNSSQWLAIGPSLTSQAKLQDDILIYLNSIPVATKTDVWLSELCFKDRGETSGAAAVAASADAAEETINESACWKIFIGACFGVNSDAPQSLSGIPSENLAKFISRAASVVAKILLHKNFIGDIRSNLQLIGQIVNHIAMITETGAKRFNMTAALNVLGSLALVYDIYDCKATLKYVKSERAYRKEGEEFKLLDRFGDDLSRYSSAEYFLSILGQHINAQELSKLRAPAGGGAAAGVAMGAGEAAAGVAIDLAAGTADNAKQLSFAKKHSAIINLLEWAKVSWFGFDGESCFTVNSDTRAIFLSKLLECLVLRKAVKGNIADPEIIVFLQNIPPSASAAALSMLTASLEAYDLTTPQPLLEYLAERLSEFNVAVEVTSNFPSLITRANSTVASTHPLVTFSNIVDAFFELHKSSIATMHRESDPEWLKVARGHVTSEHKKALAAEQKAMNNRARVYAFEREEYLKNSKASGPAEKELLTRAASEATRIATEKRRIIQKITNGTTDEALLTQEGLVGRVVFKILDTPEQKADKVVRRYSLASGARGTEEEVSIERLTRWLKDAERETEARWLAVNAADKEQKKLDEGGKSELILKKVSLEAELASIEARAMERSTSNLPKDKRYRGFLAQVMRMIPADQLWALHHFLMIYDKELVVHRAKYFLYADIICTLQPYGGVMWRSKFFNQYIGSTHREVVAAGAEAAEHVTIDMEGAALLRGASTLAGRAEIPVALGGTKDPYELRLLLFLIRSKNLIRGIVAADGGKLKKLIQMLSDKILEPEFESGKVFNVQGFLKIVAIIVSNILLPEDHCCDRKSQEIRTRLLKLLAIRDSRTLTLTEQELQENIAILAENPGLLQQVYEIALILLAETGKPLLPLEAYREAHWAEILKPSSAMRRFTVPGIPGSIVQSAYEIVEAEGLRAKESWRLSRGTIPPIGVLKWLVSIADEEHRPESLSDKTLQDLAQSLIRPEKLGKWLDFIADPLMREQLALNWMKTILAQPGMLDSLMRTNMEKKDTLLKVINMFKKAFDFDIARQLGQWSEYQKMDIFAKVAAGILIHGALIIVGVELYRLIAKKDEDTSESRAVDLVSLVAVSVLGFIAGALFYFLKKSHYLLEAWVEELKAQPSNRRPYIVIGINVLLVITACVAGFLSSKFKNDALTTASSKEEEQDVYKYVGTLMLMTLSIGMGVPAFLGGAHYLVQSGWLPPCCRRSASVTAPRTSTTGSAGVVRDRVVESPGVASAWARHARETGLESLRVPMLSGDVKPK